MLGLFEGTVGVDSEGDIDGLEVGFDVVGPIVGEREVGDGVLGFIVGLDVTAM